MRKILGENSIYLRKFFTNPGKLGSVIPTSKISADYLAKYIKQDGYIIELGAGTGSLTSAILSAGVDPGKLICIEIDPIFCKILEQKFPQVRIMCADACNLDVLLDEDVLNDVATVVSAIPLLLLSKKLRYDLVACATRVLREDGRFIQVSYSPFSPVPWRELNLKQRRYGTIFKNLPPITVFGYEK